jgi:hypothetical protein
VSDDTRSPIAYRRPLTATELDEDADKDATAYRFALTTTVDESEIDTLPTAYRFADIATEELDDVFTDAFFTTSPAIDAVDAEVTANDPVRITRESIDTELTASKEAAPRLTPKE